MIRRFVFIKLNAEHATEEGRTKVAAYAKRIFPLLDGVQKVRIGHPADDKAVASWDVALTVDFKRLEDFQRYYDDPDHRAFVDEFLAPRLAAIKAWNFDMKSVPNA